MKTTGVQARGIRLIVALACNALALASTDLPSDLLRRILDKETESVHALRNYGYRQSVQIEELDPAGSRRGLYRETREIAFSVDGKRLETFIGRPYAHLLRLQLTAEDFRDLREVQPFQLNSHLLPLYELRFKGEEVLDGVSCWVIQVRPRQILEGQRLFEGMLWVRREDDAIIRLEGRAVPQILGRRRENLFPYFTTFRTLVDGKYWFPRTTFADDMLPFRSGPLRMRIDYENYRRFAVDSTIRFESVK